MVVSDLPAVFDWHQDAAGGQARIPAWLRFDVEWYRKRYPEAVAEAGSAETSALLQNYLQQGQKAARSPNRWFDETWYLVRNPDVATAVREDDLSSGFEHYVRYGYSDRAPHWLFSEAHYRVCNPGITTDVLRAGGFVNGYDHYLSGGEEGIRSGSLFFDPSVSSVCLFKNTQSAEVLTEYSRFLGNVGEDGSFCRTSWYFDPKWYVDVYEEVSGLIEAGQYTSPLHHYLVTGRALGYSPQESFSENFYRTRYPDVKDCIDAGIFECGYEHFLTAGAVEGRLPSSDFSLAAYASRGAVRADIECGLFRDPYAHWVAAETRRDVRFVSEKIDEMDAKLAFCRVAKGLTTEAARNPLDFSFSGKAQLSVIMVLYNQFPLTLTALASLRATFPGAIELILIDSCSDDETRNIDRYVHGAKIVHLGYNAGFLLSCNMALDYVTSDVVLYLNNDVRVAPGAIQVALKRLRSSPDIGAVGGKIIRTNGLLQEAGSIIWRDGATFGYLRDADPSCPEANFVRDVDYCSGAFLMVPSVLVTALDGFDRSFCPAYFEEADFCVRLIRKGYRVVYDPSVVIEHLEFGSSTSAASMALMQRNRRIFVNRQNEFLRNQYPAHIGNAVLARSRPGSGPRVLYIEDRVPLRSLGSGYVRSNDIVQSLARSGCSVTVFPVHSHYHSLSRIYSDFPDTVEVLFDRSVEDLDSFLEERAGAFDAVWIGRTHNLARILPVLYKNSRYMPARGFVLDTEAVVAPRALMREAVLNPDKPKDEKLEIKLREEFECAYFCQRVVAVTEREAEFIRQAGHENVSILGHALRVKPTPRSFRDRRGILFVGAIVDGDSPNLDSLLWFMEHVMPRIREELGNDVFLTAVGTKTRGVDLRGLQDFDGIEIVDNAEDLHDFYDRHRVFVAPTRFAGGIPYKIHESAASGLPVVASDVLIRQLGWTTGQDIMSGGAPAAATFATAVAELYRDEGLWSGIRQSALERVEKDCSPEVFDRAVMEILNTARSGA